MIGVFRILLILTAVLVLIIAPLIALIEVLKSRFEENKQIMWVLVIIFTGIVGAILYWSIGRNQRI